MSYALAARPLSRKPRWGRAASSSLPERRKSSLRPGESVSSRTYALTSNMLRCRLRTGRASETHRCPRAPGAPPPRSSRGPRDTSLPRRVSPSGAPEDFSAAPSLVACHLLPARLSADSALVGADRERASFVCASMNEDQVSHLALSKLDAGMMTRWYLAKSQRDRVHRRIAAR